MDDPSRITITICGDGGCGKSSITLRLVRSQWTSEYDPTIEDSYSITRRIDGQTYHLSLTDTAGQEEYRGMWGGANLRSDAFLMVYDITNADSLDQLEYFNELIDMETETRLDAATSAIKSAPGRSGAGAGAGKGSGRGNASNGAALPVKIVAGNKCDLQESRQVDAKTGLEWARRRNCGFMETSARNVVNIEETFALIVRRVVERRRAAAEMASGIRGGGGGGRGAGRDGQGVKLPREGLAFDVGALGGEAGVGTRRAVTAPLSPLPSAGDEKGVMARAWIWFLGNVSSGNLFALMGKLEGGASSRWAPRCIWGQFWALAEGEEATQRIVSKALGKELQSQSIKLASLRSHDSFEISMPLL